MHRHQTQRHEPLGYSNDDSGGDGDSVSQRCTHCGASIDREEWHPVATLRDDEGTAEIYDFCSDDCRSAWEAETTADD